MTVVNDLLGRLSALGCRAELTEGSVKVVGEVDRVPTSLMAEARRAKLALRHTLLRQQAQALVAIIDGDTPLAQRQVKLPELRVVEERLFAAQKALWASWRQDGFLILWSTVLEEFILVGDPPPPPGSEALALYTRAEVEAMKVVSPEAVVQAHRVKKAFRGMVRREK